MDTKYKTVVQGEASESDDDEEFFTEEPRSVVVDGEASESDEEEIDTSSNSLKKAVPYLKLNEHSTLYESLDDITSVPTLSPKQAGRPKYDNVLNRKLWESNLSLCNNLNGLVSQTYLSAAKEITNCSQQLSKSHASLQDVSHNMRLMTNDCFNIQDLFDTITTCKLLPNIQLPKKPTPAATSSLDHSSTPAAGMSTKVAEDKVASALDASQV